MDFLHQSLLRIMTDLKNFLTFFQIFALTGPQVGTTVVTGTGGGVNAGK